MTSPSRSVFVIGPRAAARRGVRRALSEQPDLDWCGEAPDGAGAMPAIEMDAPDVVVIDAAGGVQRAVSLIERIHGRCPRSAVLVVTADEAPHVAERLLRAGARGYVAPTGTDVSPLIEAIRRVGDGEMVLTHEVRDPLIRRLVRSGAPVAGAEPMARLTDRELQVFLLIGEGLITREIAERLGLSAKTIEAYRGHIRRKLDLRGPRELNELAAQWVGGSNDH